MDLTNLLSQNKILAYILSISLFTNAGLPPATLFFAKFFILFEVYQTFNFL
ncbi:MAG: hypothetical protein KDH96_07645 [Candidatus Riesia sp.]|nr:hypothetical protein [Candidatus Riesia sp.]